MRNSRMHARAYLLLSCLLAVSAIACQLTWLGYCGRSLTLRAQAATLTVDVRAAAIEGADRVLTSGWMYPFLGFVAAIAALLFAFVARRQREPASMSLPFALLACCVMTLFLLV